MKNNAMRTSLFAALPLLVACCAPAQPVVVQAVGPAPEGTQTTQGFLQVFTPTEEFGSDGPAFLSGYRVYSMDGVLLEDVYDNGSVTIGQENPRMISLAEGKYLVEAKQNSDVRVPVVIEDGRVTIVDMRRHSSRSLQASDATSRLLGVQRSG